MSGTLLAHDLATLVLHQVALGQAPDGLRLGSTEDDGLGHFALRNLAHSLLLHCLHGFHGCHSLHRLHCLCHFK